MSYKGPIFTLVAIAVFGGLIGYALIHGSGGGTSNQTTVPIQTLDPNATNIPGTGVGFVSPLDGATTQNPIPVTLAVGGLRLQSADQPVSPGFGHMGVVIDGDIPPVGQKYIADATHIDLRDGGHALTLPLLDPGPHTLSVFFMDSANISNGPLLGQTIHITVG
ncbi:MAG: DUF4399 domain-containing protein [Chloroflexota bacterium]